MCVYKFCVMKILCCNFFCLFIGFISDSINQAYKAYNSKTDDSKINLAVWCGTAGTGLNSDKLCLYLDNDKKSLYCANMNMYSLTKKFYLFKYFDYGK